MSREALIEQLVQEALDNNLTAEDVCAEHPELICEVLERLRLCRNVEAQLEAIFPSPDELAHRESHVPRKSDTEFPKIPGYELQAILGRGGMGVVYKARHVKLNRPVALKMLLAGLFATRPEIARFKREAEAVAALRHPNIVQIYDIGDFEGRPYFTMEYMEGGTLAARLAGAPQPGAQSAALIVVLAGAIQIAHQAGIVHRDLKPANIFLTADGTPKIGDFGLARYFEDDSGLTITGTRVGTPSYMAPEQAIGKASSVGPAADIYSLGAILYEMLTGRPPFRGETASDTERQVMLQLPVPPSRLNGKVTRDLETICLKCLEKQSQRRYDSAAALAEDLSRFLRGEPILARRASPVERLVKWIRRHPSLAASIIAGVLLISVLLGVGTSAFFARAALKRAVTEDLDQVVLAQKDQKWGEARTALVRAKARLGDGGPADLHERAARLERELALVATLEQIIFAQMMDPDVARVQRTKARFEAALREAGLIDGQDEAPAVVAARIRTTVIAASVLAALDNWADDSWVDGSAQDAGRRDWVLEIARLVDEDPASRPIRDGKLWENKQALEAFAQSAPLANQSVPFLIFLSRKLSGHGGDTLAFLKRVQEAHVNSEDANAILANTLRARGNAAESVRYFQAAIALRPNAASLRNNLARALGKLGRWEEALGQLEEARRLVPDSAVYNMAIGLTLNNMNKPAEAERQLRRVLENHPDYPPCLTGLGDSLFLQRRHEEALKTYRRAIAADPSFAEAYLRLKEGCMILGRREEGRQAWQQWLACNPSKTLIWEGHAQTWDGPNPVDHTAWDGYAELCLYLGNEAEYRRARTELLKRFGNAADPQVAERTGRACLFLPLKEDERRRAAALIDRALSADQKKYGWLMPYFRFAKALAEYRAGRFESALTLLDSDTQKILVPGPHLLLAMVQHRLGQADAARDSFQAAIAAFDWDAKQATNREAWIYHLLRREAETVLAGNNSDSVNL